MIMRRVLANLVIIIMRRRKMKIVTIMMIRLD